MRSHLFLPCAAMTVFAALADTACHPAIKPTQPGPITPTHIAELWNAPPPDRDLYFGVGGKALAPDATAKYTVIAIKRGGFSEGYTVVDPEQREWSAKFRPEALTEVVASRIFWGVGYHQPPIYLLEKWTAEKAPAPNPQFAARFREKAPRFHGLEDAGAWSYYQNPFVGTRELAGLLVLQALLGNSDLKDENNALYRLREPAENAKQWYVARDLGHTFGRMGLMDAPRGDIAAFEITPFIKGVSGGRVQFEVAGRHNPLFENIRVEDVRWICGWLDRLTDRQWNDAFRAGGFDQPTAQRFIRRLKQKIAEGLAVQG